MAIMAFFFVFTITGHWVPALILAVFAGAVEKMLDHGDVAGRG